jgi:hypothetical protein
VSSAFAAGGRERFGWRLSSQNLCLWAGIGRLLRELSRVRVGFGQVSVVRGTWYWGWQWQWQGYRSMAGGRGTWYGGCGVAEARERGVCGLAGGWWYVVLAVVVVVLGACARLQPVILRILQLTIGGLACLEAKELS